MNVVILGSGFAALTAVKTLRKQGYKDAITLISPKSSLFYYPSLIWVPAGLRDEASLTVPLDNFFTRHKVDYQQATVTGLDPSAKKVLTDTGEFSFDYLIVGTGGRFIKKLPGIEHAYAPCEGFAATKEYSDKLNRLHSGTLAFGFSGNPQEPSAMRGGPIFEFLFGIDSLLRKRGRRDKFKLIFFSPAARPGQRLGDQAVDKLLAEMEKRGIETHLGHKLKQIEADKVITEGGEFASDLTMFMPGMTGPAWAGESNLALSEGGFFQVDESCRAAGHDTIFIAGDSGSFPGPDWMPKQAHMADLQAEAAVKNLLAVMRGKKPENTYKVELICIVDTLNSGILVYRDTQKSRLFPGGVFFHWLKRFFEWHYLRAYR
jgi:sulfide:quinone oxidoreductase